MGPFNDFGLSLMEMRSNGDSQAVKRNNPNYALNIFLDTMFVSNFRRMKEVAGNHSEDPYDNSGEQ